MSFVEVYKQPNLLKRLVNINDEKVFYVLFDRPNIRNYLQPITAIYNSLKTNAV